MTFLYIWTSNYETFFSKILKPSSEDLLMAEFSRALSVCNHSSLLKSDIFGLTTVGFYLSQIYFGEYLDLTQVVSTVVAFILYLVISFFIATLFRSSRILCEKFDNLKRFFFWIFRKKYFVSVFWKKSRKFDFWVALSYSQRENFHKWAFSDKWAFSENTGI